MNANNLKKWMHRCLSVAIIGFLISCSPVYMVSYDYDRTVHFDSIKSYDFLTVPEDPNLNRLDRMRIEKTVDAVLFAKGFKRSAEHPDFLIRPKLMQKDVMESTWGYNSYTPYGYPWRGPDYYVYEYEESSLILEMIVPGSKGLLWQGSAKARLDVATTPEKRDRIITQAVERILSLFPPLPAG